MKCHQNNLALQFTVDMQYLKETPQNCDHLVAFIAVIDEDDQEIVFVSEKKDERGEADQTETQPRLTSATPLPTSESRAQHHESCQSQKSHCNICGEALPLDEATAYEQYL